VQGLQDPYGTLAQIHGVVERVPQTEIIEIPECEHSPHREKSEPLISGVMKFLKQHQKSNVCLSTFNIGGIV